MIKKSISIFLSLGSLGLLIFAFFKSQKSDLFQVRNIKVAWQSSGQNTDQNRLSDQTILKLAGLTELNGQKINNLHRLDLKRIEKSILEHPWVESVKLNKIFPDTLQIEPKMKRALYVLQENDGKLTVIDPLGQFIAPWDSSFGSEMPVLSGVPQHEVEQLAQVAKLISKWQSHQPLAKLAKVDSLRPDESRGFRLMVRYKINGESVYSNMFLRQDFEEIPDKTMQSLDLVFSYLHEKRISVSEVRFGEDKKVVVKKRHSS